MPSSFLYCDAEYIHTLFTYVIRFIITSGPNAPTIAGSNSSRIYAWRGVSRLAAYL